jgi:hypothetical protein
MENAAQTDRVKLKGAASRVVMKYNSTRLNIDIGIRLVLSLLSKICLGVRSCQEEIRLSIEKSYSLIIIQHVHTLDKQSVDERLPSDEARPRCPCLNSQSFEKPEDRNQPYPHPSD